MRFHGKALQGANQVVSFDEEAPDRNSLLKGLRDRGLTPISVKERGGFWTRFFPAAKSKVGKEAFLTEVSVLLRSGIRLQEALAILEKTSGPGAPLYRGLLEDVKNGKPFSAAVAGAGLLGPTELALLTAGEDTGEFRSMLEALVMHVKEDATVRRRLFAMAVYPAFLMAFATVVLLYILIGVLPKLIESMGELEGNLPPVSKALIGVLHQVGQYGWLWPLLMVAAVYGAIRYYRKNPVAVMTRALKLPLAGDLIRMRLQSAFLPALLVLLKKKVPVKDISKALQGSFSGLPVVGPLLAKLEAEKGRGVKLSGILGSSELFTIREKELLRVGEEASRLTEMLEELHRSNLEQYESRTKAIMSLLEPAAIVGIGLVVLAFVLTVVLPIINLQVSF